MKMNKCPGAYARKFDSIEIPCPDCGQAVEIFSDETEHRCRCGRMLSREDAAPRADQGPAATK